MKLATLDFWHGSSITNSSARLDLDHRPKQWDLLASTWRDEQDSVFSLEELVSTKSRMIQ